MQKRETGGLFFFAAAEMAWRPAADIYRTRTGWVIKLDLAGVCPADVTIVAHGAQLLITGVRHDRIVEEGWNHYALEISYNRFERTIELPCELEQVDYSVECREGMLLVRVTLKEEGNKE